MFLNIMNDVEPILTVPAAKMTVSNHEGLTMHRHR